MFYLKLFLPIFLLLASVKAQDRLSNLMLNSADSQLNVFIGSEISPEGNKIPYLKYKKEGSLILGQPYNVSYLDFNKIIKNDILQTTINEITKKTTFWLFPVLLKGKPIEILTLQEDSGKWIPVSFGRCQFSRELNLLKTAWQDSTIMLFESPTGDCFFSIKELGSSNLTPINSVSPDSTRIGERIISYRNIQNVSQTIEGFKAQIRNLKK